jgi:hypothetical protein
MSTDMRPARSALEDPKAWWRYVCVRVIKEECTGHRSLRPNELMLLCMEQDTTPSREVVHPTVPVAIEPAEVRLMEDKNEAIDEHINEEEVETGGNSSFVEEDTAAEILDDECTFDLQQEEEKIEIVDELETDSVVELMPVAGGAGEGSGTDNNDQQALALDEPAEDIKDVDDSLQEEKSCAEQKMDEEREIEKEQEQESEPDQEKDQDQESESEQEREQEQKSEQEEDSEQRVSHSSENEEDLVSHLDIEVRP